MAVIPPFFLDCVVSIGIENQPEPIWIGTGFIVGRTVTDETGAQKFNESGDKLYHTFLVTNKHVLHGHKRIFIRFNSMQGEDVIDYPVDLEINNERIWIGNPSEEIDVATFSINPDVPKNDSAVFQFFQLDGHSLNIAQMKQMGVSEGTPVFVLGFPMGIVASKYNCVVSRFGSIARIRDVLNSQQSAYLIDANVFPGNSGGPVVTKPEITSIEGTPVNNRADLIGIVKSYVPYSDVAISQQTGKPRVIFEENSGLALVETVDSIKQTVDLCYQLKVIGKN